MGPCIIVSFCNKFCIHMVIGANRFYLTKVVKTYDNQTNLKLTYNTFYVYHFFILHLFKKLLFY
ncbi:hypothetical protein GLOIN_2v1582207 [Rhizophagus irregularis DAOM 181602=DAOM 197198]|uniref:Uncharacterized protein n=1 Tax=Rhizophagus irregularis (strain DAOM 181602 / DAOM 197198 / MUCL 43194) TaxID=747089 RepID=A0A2P4Q7U7_RHIID|nr:hypothetical protein GLOIN_2v1582207 [Rhizophagus irregularis DAOM 181602=DAOM 197198]POG73723.1 hypothetical protein GLOIN_2v1582207 [Rhizophagus irregularis DAOM 181602=DAOM 197198]|eukprot:XP_025180589.1 hypothetical protein GLOIN_2v1582207 [Rhizophagus irregularis DAOM 181602=DAOM 197198]